MKLCLDRGVYATSFAVLVFCLRPALMFKCPEEINRVCTCFTRNVYVSGVREERHYVDCSSRGLFSLPFFDFPEEMKLYSVNIRNNSVTALSLSNFRNSIHISRIDVSRNPLGSYLESDLFSTKIKSIETFIGRDIGLNLQNVTSLEFIRNSNSLKELDLSGNMEYGVDMLPALFQDNNIHSLVTLSLALCRIRRINPHAFIGLVHLQDIDLSQNFLKKVPKALQRLTLLRRLNLSENDIAAISYGDFIELHCLQELDLSKNLLGQLDAFRPGAFYGLEDSLTSLRLHDSFLTSPPTDVLSGLKKLEHLDISLNGITEITNFSFIGNYGLASLDISENPLIIHVKMFDSVRRTLRVLRMRKTGLNYIPYLGQLHMLEELDLSFNSITSIDSYSLKGVSARRLLFSGNRIQTIDSMAFSQYHLPVHLDVSYNELVSLNFVLDSPKCTFYEVNVSSNGFLCDCQIEKLINSRLTHRLVGDCMLRTGEKIPFNNATLVTELVRQCGRTHSSYCFWWVKNSAESWRSHGYNIMSFVLLMLIIDLYKV
ncbi:leucine-rich repeats and immunoglobulin-like domains protein sma-10 isoform X2 [Dreissena polymorpha]|uniref:Uncharacterized protein n=2 Tax=Dreissena polymorpha TaxID=45954 RepID=A0A9D3YAS3_DREPO|nr:leucine-rich repeats and immunoglobulin-like domains protein sma-10 isoform X2 [Dreissena polymorpha]KAH3697078.1 hypothetical protein DPMN_084563 [Dreissena polymorpha]